MNRAAEAAEADASVAYKYTEQRFISALGGKFLEERLPVPAVLELHQAEVGPFCLACPFPLSVVTSVRLVEPVASVL